MDPIKLYAARFDFVRFWQEPEWDADSQDNRINQDANILKILLSG